MSIEYSISVKLLTKHHLEFLSLKGGCRGSSDSTLVKMSNCWKSHAAAHLIYWLQEGGVCVVDRGFKDVIDVFEELGL